MDRGYLCKDSGSIPQGGGRGAFVGGREESDRTAPPAAAPERLSRAIRIAPEQAGQRLDQALAACWPDLSRARIQQWIATGQIQVDGQARRGRDRVRGDESVTLEAVLEAEGDCQPQDIALRVVFEDAQLLVIDKPAGLVVHPAAGNRDGTLQNALLHRDPALAAIPRAGIVHRLDKETSGLLVVARTLAAHKSLVEQLRRRLVHREYRALAVGRILAGGRVEAPVGRHPTQRTRMAVVAGGRPAATRYRVLERYPGHSLLAVELETGRTHQIRVHLAHLGHPLVGDPVYGVRPRPPRGVAPELTAALQTFPRQALHALRLGLQHPADGTPMTWEAPLPADFAGLLDLLRREAPGDAAHPA